MKTRKNYFHCIENCEESIRRKKYGKVTKRPTTTSTIDIFPRRKGTSADDFSLAAVFSLSYHSY